MEIAAMSDEDLALALQAGNDSAFDELVRRHQGRVYAVDGSSYFSRPGPRVVDGIELLAEVFDPLAFDGTAPPDGWARAG